MVVQQTCATSARKYIISWSMILIIWRCAITIEFLKNIFHFSFLRGRDFTDEKSLSHYFYIVYVAVYIVLRFFHFINQFHVANKQPADNRVISILDVCFLDFKNYFRSWRRFSHKFKRKKAGLKPARCPFGDFYRSINLWKTNITHAETVQHHFSQTSAQKVACSSSPFLWNSERSHQSDIIIILERPSQDTLAETINFIIFPQFLSSSRYAK